MKHNDKASIILMGIKHCGKSTQGKIIASKLGMPFYDTDDVILNLTGKTAREIFNAQGEEAFKEAEKNACGYVAHCVEQEGGAVIATGGGICNNEAALEVLHGIGTFVFLVADEKTAADRIMREALVNEDGTVLNLPAYIAKKNPRSLEEAREIFHEFYAQRVKLYSAIADCSVRMEAAPKCVNADRIISLLGRGGY